MFTSKREEKKFETAIFALAAVIAIMVGAVFWLVVFAIDRLLFK